MSKDPVCGETVEVQRHTPKKLYKGVIYHFCSEECRAEFKQDPDGYTNRGPRASAYS